MADSKRLAVRAGYSRGQPLSADAGTGSRPIFLTTICNDKEAVKHGRVPAWRCPGTGSGGWEYAGTGTPGSPHARRQVWLFGDCVTNTGTGTHVPVPPQFPCCPGVTLPNRLYLCLSIDASKYPQLEYQEGIYPLDWYDYSYPHPFGGHYVYYGFAPCSRAPNVGGGCVLTLVRYSPCLGPTPAFGGTGMLWYGVFWCKDIPPPGVPPGFCSNFNLSWSRWSTMQSYEHHQCDPWYDEVFTSKDLESGIHYVVSAQPNCGGFAGSPFTGTGTGSQYELPTTTRFLSRALAKRTQYSADGRDVFLLACCPPKTGTGSFWPLTGTGTHQGPPPAPCNACPSDTIPDNLTATLSGGFGCGLSGQTISITKGGALGYPCWQGSKVISGRTWTQYMCCQSDGQLNAWLDGGAGCVTNVAIRTPSSCNPFNSGSFGQLMPSGCPCMATGTIFSTIT